jgi:hypothetical protein
VGAGGAAAGAGAAGGAAAAAGGVGSTIAGLATNPFTIAAAGGIALGFAIWKKGLFRGGEEALKVSPRRDQFLGQFGGPGHGETSGFHRLAAQLTAWTGEPGGGRLHAALRNADKVHRFEAAQAAIVAAYAQHGRTIRSFAMGGFVPPGVVQPAIVHGGARGEVILPLDQLTRPPSRDQTVTIHMPITIQGVLDRESVREVFRAQILPLMKQALFFNQDGLGSSVAEVVAP